MYDELAPYNILILFDLHPDPIKTYCTKNLNPNDPLKMFEIFLTANQKSESDLLPNCGKMDLIRRFESGILVFGFWI